MEKKGKGHMKAYSLIFGYFAINVSIWIFNMLAIFTVSVPAVSEPADILGLFDLTTFAMLVTGSTVIGILAVLLRQYALSGAVLLLWIGGLLYRPISDIFVGLPLLLNNVLGGTLVAVIVSQAITAFSAIILFIFIVEVLAGRQIT